MPAPQTSGGSIGTSRCAWRGDGARSSDAQGTRTRAFLASAPSRRSRPAGEPAESIRSRTEVTPSRGAVTSSTESPLTMPTRLPLPGTKYWHSFIVRLPWMASQDGTRSGRSEAVRQPGIEVDGRRRRQEALDRAARPCVGRERAVGLVGVVEQVGDGHESRQALPARAGAGAHREVRAQRGLDVLLVAAQALRSHPGSRGPERQPRQQVMVHAEVEALARNERDVAAG